MIEFFSSISNAIQLGVSFLGSLISNTLAVFGLIGQGTVFLGTLTAFLPPVLIVFATLTIAISIVFLVIGR